MFSKHAFWWPAPFSKYNIFCDTWHLLWQRYMSGAVGSVDRRVSSLATKHFHLEILKFQFSQYKTVMGQQHIASYYYEMNKKLLVWQFSQALTASNVLFIANLYHLFSLKNVFEVRFFRFKSLLSAIQLI